MTVIIIEDEDISAEKLERLLLKYDSTFKILTKLDSITSTVKWFSENAMPDVAFFDIQLSDGLSFEIFQQVKVTCPIVFTTAFNQYAIEAFKVNSIDYLLKPFDIEDIQGAFEKLNRLRGNKNKEDLDLSAIQNMIQLLSKPQYKTRFMIKIGEHINSIATEDIAYFQGENKMAWAFLKSGKKYPIDYTLDRLEEMLDPIYFFRLNRQYISAIESIKQIISHSNSRLKIIFHNMPPEKEDIIVGREKVERFKNWLGR